jgi:hypothetical protein
MKATKTGSPPAAKIQPKPGTGPCSCGCHGRSEGGGCTCCQPICFERPNYFCGQLLSDDDLSAEQRYFREKQKLYHRTLHGHGVVCGLRLTCDPDCCGRIRIGDGYAIDNCGNDLVVCQPMPFDVIAALEAKGWLITEPPPDPCEDEEPPRCKVKQCFYITICYDEEAAEYTTPFKTNCGPGAAACEPTRIRETVRFDVLDDPPRSHTDLDELEERITRHWKVFTEGPLAGKLSEFLADRQRGDQEGADYCMTFCQLKVLFQHHLKRHPDQYDCTLWEQVCRLQCPTEDRQRYEVYRESFDKLYELIVRYAYDGILGEFIFECPCPPKAHCVVLGTVEVEDGKLLRVCNCPRTYVWTFANLVEVFLATYVGGAACAPQHHGGKDEEKRATETTGEERIRRESDRHCCATFEVESELFQTLFQTKRTFGKINASTPIHLIRRVSEALKTGFHFTHPLAISPEIFKDLSRDQAVGLARALAALGHGKGDDTPVLDIFDQAHDEAPDPITALLGHLLKRAGDPMVATLANDGKTIAETVARLQVPGPPEQSKEWQARVQAAETKADQAQESAEAMRRELAELRSAMDALRTQPTPAPAATAPPTGPTSPPTGPTSPPTGGAEPK